MVTASKLAERSVPRPLSYSEILKHTRDFKALLHWVKSTLGQIANTSERFTVDSHPLSCRREFAPRFKFG